MQKLSAVIWDARYSDYGSPGGGSYEAEGKGSMFERDVVATLILSRQHYRKCRWGHVAVLPAYGPSTWSLREAGNSQPAWAT